MPTARILQPFRIVAALLGVLVIVGLATPAQARPPKSIEAKVSPSDFDAEAVLIIHYRRHDDRYRGWNLWTWPDGAEGETMGFGNKTEFGRYAVVPVDPDAKRQGFIVRLGEWESRDVGGDRFVELEDDGVTEVWVVSGVERVFTDPADVDTAVRVVGAFLDDADTITLTASGTLDKAHRRGANVLRNGQPNVYQIGMIRRSDRTATSGVVYEIDLDRRVSFGDVGLLSVKLPGLGATTVYARDALSEGRFTAPNAALGARWGETSTVFRVWTPVSRSVDLLLYADLADAEPERTIALTHSDNGVWEAEVAGDLHGVAYQYRYKSYGKTRVAPDIHCFAATADGQRSIVVDFARLLPDLEVCGEPPILAAPTDEIIYEVHVRDFSINDRSLEPSARGTYAGLIHQGAMDVAGGTVRTGLGHLEELGVSAVHLLPIHDFPGEPESYNWGYWTSFFNVPESSYATDPHDSLGAIRELKTAISVLHFHGIRVILDVVYNHTSSSGEHSPFHQSVPYYYFRTTVDGKWRNDAGVGNSIADERPMVRKFVGDSLEFWAAEYQIDGFRFDLVGTHHPESVRAWVQRARAIRPDLTMYGEPWTGGGPVYFPKGTQKGMGFAVFNDHYRNAIRGDLDGTSTGFATGPGGDLLAVRKGFMGAIDDFTETPAEAVNYISAHDNRTFWDKMVHSTPGATDAERRSMQKLALGMVLTSQGIAFLHGASDFCRTKGGNHNSYNAGDVVNAFDWERKAEYREVFDYVAGLIELRRAHPVFRMADREMVHASTRFPLHPNHHLVVATLDGEASGDSWGTVLVAYNGAAHANKFALPGGTWNVVVDSESAGVQTLRTATGRVSLPPYSMAVMHR